jgi:uncharacterized protein (TIGR02246 family)
MTSVDPSERSEDAVLRAVAGAFEDAWNQRDAQRVADVFTEDAVMEDPGAPDSVLRGRSAIRAYFESWLRAFPDAQMRQEVLFTPLDGGEYASRWRIWGTMEQTFSRPASLPPISASKPRAWRSSSSGGASCRAADSSTTRRRLPGSSAPRRREAVGSSDSE